MFNNIGGKIKALTKICCAILCVLSLVVGILLIVFNTYNEEMIGIGICILIFGPLLSWVGSFLLYGFGELVENTTVIAELLAKADAERKP